MQFNYVSFFIKNDFINNYSFFKIINIYINNIIYLKNYLLCLLIKIFNKLL